MYIHAAIASFGASADPAPGIDLVPRSMARRMGPALRRSVGCALAALKAAGIERPDAIYFGTGLGCLADTREFLEEIDRNAGSTLSPTSFMRSTHNTVPGLIALAIKAVGPNLTFSQGLLSFHAALLNATLHVERDPDHMVLVGAADEHLPLLDALAGALPDVALPEGAVLSEGAAFLVVSGRSNEARTCIREAWVGAAEQLTARMNMTGKILTGPVLDGRPPIDPSGEPYALRTGLHQSAPALALVIAHDELPAQEHSRTHIIDRAGERCGLITVERC
ncbi:MAG: beta-ketoacyl synthase chain length factor [Flavobacteriales bacterium]|nr:beta-ketoacyl synthase chain length factor [Flavobacteriales bacterium]MCB9167603.1 beta-ketoacyl synthase chain length factor [Flavobacteriales bacterium]